MDTLFPPKHAMSAHAISLLSLLLLLASPVRAQPPSSAILGGSSITFTISGEPDSASGNTNLLDTSLWDEFPITLLERPDYNVEANLNPVAPGITTPSPTSGGSPINGSSNTPAPSTGNEGLSWWMIMLIVISSVIGVVALALGIYYAVRANARPSAVVTPSATLPPPDHLMVSPQFRYTGKPYAYSKIIQVPLVNQQIVLHESRPVQASVTVFTGGQTRQCMFP